MEVKETRSARFGKYSFLRPYMFLREDSWWTRVLLLESCCFFVCVISVLLLENGNRMIKWLSYIRVRNTGINEVTEDTGILSVISIVRIHYRDESYERLNYQVVLEFGILRILWILGSWSCVSFSL